MDGRKPTAVIVGGGIGGLCAGLALRQAGYEVGVYEAAPEIREVGAGLTLWPNALRALDLLGVGEQVRALGVPDVGGGIYTWRGMPLAVESSEAFVARYGRFPVVVHRAEFSALLAEALGRERLHLGARLLDVVQGEGWAEARFADGETVRGDVLVGADGIRSTVRKSLFPETAPRYAGYTAWRMLVPFAHSQISRWGEFWGRGERVGVVPVSGERVYLFATANLPPEENLNEAPGKRKLNLMRRFVGWGTPIPELIAAADAASILRNDVEELPPLARWSEGHITLLGDAAHAMTPNLGQGACQAIEDAVVLGACLRECAGGSAHAALAQYEEKRRRRARRIQSLSRRIGQIGQWDNRFACALRNRALRHSPTGSRLRLLDAVLGYDIAAVVR